MANELNGEVAWPVGEATYTLRYKIGTLIGLEEKLDLSTAEIVERLQGRVRLGFLRDVLIAGLAEHHKLSAQQVEDLIGEAGVIDTVIAVLTAFAAAFPRAKTAEEGAPADPPPAAAGTGNAT